MAEGVLPWHRPWAVDPNARVSKPLRENGMPYRGINVLVLWGAAIDKGYASPSWMTYRRAQLTDTMPPGEPALVGVLLPLLAAMPQHQIVGRHQDHRVASPADHPKS